MIEIKDTCYKGTRILLGNEKRKMISEMITVLEDLGFQEISIPIIQFQDTFAAKVGEENNNLMFNFRDRGNRDVCLAPEYTAVIQQLAGKRFKHAKDLRVFYVQECFRGEKPQAGRYRQFTQLGVEIINPTTDHIRSLGALAHELIANHSTGWGDQLVLDYDVRRGLDYYKNGKGFEITAPSLGAQKQVCGGGEYDGGVGFAIGIDRILKIEE